jgi:hypothetical protein
LYETEEFVLCIFAIEVWFAAVAFAEPVNLANGRSVRPDTLSDACRSAAIYA